MLCFQQPGALRGVHSDRVVVSARRDWREPPRVAEGRVGWHVSEQAAQWCWAGPVSGAVPVEMPGLQWARAFFCSDWEVCVGSLRSHICSVTKEARFGVGFNKPENRPQQLTAWK